MTHALILTPWKKTQVDPYLSEAILIYIVSSSSASTRTTEEDSVSK